MFFALGRFWGGLVFGRTTFRILTALVESTDDARHRGESIWDDVRVPERDLGYRITHVFVWHKPDAESAAVKQSPQTSAWRMP
jgi:hypothetical protein